MKPTALTAVLYVLLLGLSTAWTTRTGGTFYPDGRTEDWTRYGPGALLTVTSQDSGAASVDVHWWALVLFLAGGYALARVAALLVEHVARRTVPVARWLVMGSAVTVLLALVAALGWSRYYWGYFTDRPTTAEAVRGMAAVHGISMVRCDLSQQPRCEPSPDRTVTEEVESCRRDPYECLGGRIAVGLGEAGLLSASTPPLRPEVLRRVEAAFADRSLLAPVEPGYEGNQTLGGVVADAEYADGGPMLAVGLEGLQVSNDHYPYYELHLAGAGPPRILRSATFFHDVAGIEGLEWRQAFLIACVLGLTIWTPLGLIAGVAVSLRRRSLARLELSEGEA